MNCPYCKIPSMRRVVSSGKEIDCCTACGALWFDYGEVRELTEGRFSPDPDGEQPQPPAETPEIPEKPGAVISRMRREAASRRCPRCDAPLSAVNFRVTGIPVLQCRSCEGILAPRRSALVIADRFRFLREHEAQAAGLGKSLAEETRRRMESRYGSSGPVNPDGMAVPLPIIVPLADDAPETGSFPLVTYTLIAVSVILHIIGQVRGMPLPLPGGLPGLPSGTGFAGVPKLPLLFAPFFHAGVLPLAVGSLFLFVLGDNVEDRMGRSPYFLLYLLCGVVAGAAHVLWGKAGGPHAMGSMGAVAGVLGAYLVFFPNVSIRMYGMGKIATIPAYLFACAWVVAAFFLAWGTGPIEEYLNPAALSLAGNLAGFGSGVAGAVLFRQYEEETIPTEPAERHP